MIKDWSHCHWITIKSAMCVFVCSRLMKLNNCSDNAAGILGGGNGFDLDILTNDVCKSSMSQKLQFIDLLLTLNNFYKLTH